MPTLQLKIDTNKVTLADNPSQTVQDLLSQLTKYGYATKYTEQEKGAAAQISITKSDETYMNESTKLTPSFIEELARFVELCYVQFTLDELLSRMVGLGWCVRLDDRMTSQGHIEIAMPGGRISTYTATYGGMLALRHDLDIAEVTAIVGKALPTMLRCGWKRTMDQDFYGFITRDGEVIAIPFNDVAKAQTIAANADLTANST